MPHGASIISTRYDMDNLALIVSQVLVLISIVIIVRTVRAPGRLFG